MISRPHCLEPTACQAKGTGHCRRCNASQINTNAHSDPEVRARMSAASKAALADPEVRARMSATQRRSHAKGAVRAAGLPLFRKFVDRAADMFAAGEVGEVIVDALIQEFGPRAMAPTVVGTTQAAKRVA